ncbi:hypothetical protein [[Kitasatospora] papulosa]|uniref:hypothetical protein n=1 Tax=[Kitasatospora] papulosa TaxID=1464011 RepID=UPI003682D271
MSAYDELASQVAAHGPFPMPTGDTARRPRQFTPLEEAVQGIETAIAPLKGDQRAGADMVLTYLRTLTTPGAVTEVDRLSDELTGANLALYEEELDTARLRLALASAQRGRREVREKLAGLRQGYTALEARCDYIAKAAVSWRKEADGRKAYGLTLRARVAELETALADATEPDVDGAGRTYQEYNPAPRDLRPGAEAARRMIRDRQTAEDPHDSPLHHGYALSRDLPEVAPEPSRGQCGYDDYHEGHQWADRPHVWCPGHSYADDAEATS